MRCALLALLTLPGCLVQLEADPTEPLPDRGIVPPIRDALVDAEPPVICNPVPGEVRRDDVPVGESAVIPVPLGCGGLDVTAAWLVDVEPANALRLRDLGPAPVSTINIAYTPQKIGERVTGVLYVHTDAEAYAVPIGASSRWTDEACRRWTLDVSKARIDGQPYAWMHADPPLGVAKTAANIAWRILEQPEGAATDLLESPEHADLSLNPLDDPDTPTAWYPLLEVGSYLVEGTVKPPTGANCALQAARFLVRLCPCQNDIRVDIVWSAPDGRVSEDQLDLYLLHPDAEGWDAGGLVCHGRQRHPAWTNTPDEVVLAESQRPFHSGDDVNTPGVEQVILERTQGIDEATRPYRIGVVVATQIPLDATVQIFLNGRMVRETSRRIEPEDRFWDVGAIWWQDLSLFALPFDTVSADPLPDPWSDLPAQSACLPDWAPGCAGDCRVNEGALMGQCR